MSSNRERPLSPHLTIWKWGPHMVVSILHRITGTGLTFVGLAVLAWWLAALSGGQESYSGFTAIAGNWVGLTILAGLTWAFWQHLFSGLRHLVLDTGAGYELRVNRFWAVMTVAASLFATGLTWYLLVGVGR